jgi:lysyl-tRNA synthetase class 2
MTSRLERIAQNRREKLERIRARGIEPYPHRYRRSHTTQQAVALLKQQEGSPGEAEAQVVDVAGRVTAHRSMGKISFLDIRDGSGKIQLSFHSNLIAEAIQYRPRQMI